MDAKAVLKALLERLKGTPEPDPREAYTPVHEYKHIVIIKDGSREETDALLRELRDKAGRNDKR